MTTILATGPEHGPRLLLAHGAGAPMDSPFMERITQYLVAHGIQILRFEFAYMAARRNGASKRPPPPMAKIIEEYRQVVKLLSPGPLAIGGKSMGGRAASLIIDELYQQGLVDKLILLGYPFHPPAKPENLRTSHLEQLKCPTLLCQGERDAFGTKAQVSQYALSSSIHIQWLADGDHDLKPRVISGVEWRDNLQTSAKAIADFMSAAKT